jgi:hypothetical protein
VVGGALAVNVNILDKVLAQIKLRDDDILFNDHFLAGPPPNLMEARWASAEQFKHNWKKMDGEGIASLVLIIFESELLNGYISCYAEN